MKKCIVGTCNSNSRHGSIPGLSYHKLGSIRYRSWLKAINRGEEEGISPHNVICSKHFEPSDFVYVAGKKCLKIDAVPSLHLHGIKRREKTEESNSASKMSQLQATWIKITKIDTFKPPPVYCSQSANDLSHSESSSSHSNIPMGRILQNGLSKNIKNEKHTMKNETMIEDDIKPKKGVSTDIYRNCDTKEVEDTIMDNTSVDSPTVEVPGSDTNDSRVSSDQYFGTTDELLKVLAENSTFYSQNMRKPGKHKNYPIKNFHFKEGSQSYSISREDFVSGGAWRKFLKFATLKEAQLNTANKKIRALKMRLNSLENAS
ncbi:unnamed protein product [Callosobruchus maculatus]|uniref:THAP-type domain-containing protein n=1 Tax=Callosobruchus maculatus TaxID=64391 RepID=A0A653CP44_CALMS|nr:unnamed protein product [Callosobruchus maculatus]